MLSLKKLTRPYRWVPLALVAAAIVAPSAQAFFSADDLSRLTRDCVRDAVAAAGGTRTPEPQPTSPRPGEGVDWSDAGVGVGIGVAGSLGLGAAALLASRRRLAHA